jgi:hypothetical protein
LDGVTAAWLTVAVLVIGLPLFAWWLGARGFWARLRPGAEQDPWRDAVRRHGLSTAEAAQLAREVTRGHEFEDPRLRRAAVDWAGTLLAQERPRPRTRRGRALLTALVLWAVAVLGGVLYLVVTGRPEDVNWFTVVIWTMAGIYVVRRRRGLLRTVELNGDVPAAPGAGPG